MGREKILITGGSGFVGTNLLIKLKNQKVRLFSTYYKNLKFTKIKKVKYPRVNLEKKKDCLKVCKNIDTIILCAANSSGAAVMQKTFSASKSKYYNEFKYARCRLSIRC